MQETKSAPQNSASIQTLCCLLTESTFKLKVQTYHQRALRYKGLH